MRVVSRIRGRARAVRLPAGAPADWVVLSDRGEESLLLSDEAFKMAFRSSGSGPQQMRRTPLRGGAPVAEGNQRRPAPSSLPIPGSVRERTLKALLAAPAGMSVQEIANNIAKPRFTVSSVVSTLYHGGVLTADHPPRRGVKMPAAVFRLTALGRRQAQAL